MIDPGQSELTSFLVILLEPRFQGPLSPLLNVARQDRDMKGLGNVVDRLATSRLRESERKRGTKSRDASESPQKSRLVPPAEY